MTRWLGAGEGRRAQGGVRRASRPGVSKPVASGIASTLLLGMLVVPVVVASQEDEAPPAASETTTFRSASLVAVLRAQSRLLSLDPQDRALAAIEDVVPERAAEVKAAFDSGAEAVIEQAGGSEGAAAPQLRLVPLGYRFRSVSGPVVQVSVWNRVLLTDADGEESTSHVTTHFTLRYQGEQWRVFSYEGSDSGPLPGGQAAEEYAPLPDAVAAP